MIHTCNQRKKDCMVTHSYNAEYLKLGDEAKDYGISV